MAETDVMVLKSARAILEQAADMIRDLTDEAYTTPGAQGASIGQHTRHTLDHYRKLIDGFNTSSVVVYDHRDRGVPVETDRDAALAEIASIIEGFDGLDETQLEFPVRLRAMVNGEGDEAEMDSTLVRELWFATHHAIHHDALIKTIAAEFGCTLPETYGRAPSTINFERTSAG